MITIQLPTAFVSGDRLLDIEGVPPTALKDACATLVTSYYGIMRRKTQGSMSIFFNIPSNANIPIKLVALGVSVGGNVLGMPTYIAIPESQYDDAVPAYIGVGTWREYQQEGLNHVLLDGYYYIDTASVGGDNLDGTKLALLVQDGLNVITKDQFKELS